MMATPPWFGKVIFFCRKAPVAAAKRLTSPPGPPNLNWKGNRLLSLSSRPEWDAPPPHSRFRPIHSHSPVQGRSSMFRRVYWAPVLVALLAGAAAAPGQEPQDPELAFVAQLRARGMADLALEYLEKRLSK